jgi:peptide/nickel transport system permease protein
VNARFIAAKLARALVTLWLVVTAAFLILHASGDPIEIMLGDQAEQDVIERYRVLYGLDQPLHEQYLRYFLGIARGAEAC